jgi:hydrogenase expression/formation protein HypE
VIVTSYAPDDRLPVGKLPSDLLEKLLADHVAPDPRVLVGPGIGRDAAAIAVDSGIIVAKTDPITFASEGAASYLVDVNANDIACMGAIPKFLLVTALFPEQVSVATVERHFSELGEACRRRGISLVGGHTEVSAGLDRPILVGMMLGEATADGLVRPGQARPGDRLLLSGAIAVEGTALLARELGDFLALRIDPTVLQRARRFLDDPGISVVTAARVAAGTAGFRGMHDPTEGGLGTGVRELARASECGALVDIDRVPVHPETRVIADALGLDPMGMLASGSLLVVAKPDSVERLQAAARSEGVTMTEIGELRPKEDGFIAVSGSRSWPIPEWTTDEVSRALKVYGGQRQAVPEGIE